MTFSNSVEERVKNMQIFLFAFPLPWFASQATKKGFPLYNSVTNMQADLKAHNGSRQMTKNIYAIFRFCEFLGFYRLLCLGVLDQNDLDRCDKLSRQSGLDRFYHFFSPLFISVGSFFRIFESAYTRSSSSLSLSLHLLCSRPEYGIFWHWLQVSESSSGGNLSQRRSQTTGTSVFARCDAFKVPVGRRLFWQSGWDICWSLLKCK